MWRSLEVSDDTTVGEVLANLVQGEAHGYECVRNCWPHEVGAAEVLLYYVTCCATKSMIEKWVEVGYPANSLYLIVVRRDHDMAG